LESLARRLFFEREDPKPATPSEGMARRRHSTSAVAATVAWALPTLLCGCSGSAGTAAPPDSSAIVVSPSGDDTAAGNAAAPFRTLKRALAAATPGSTIQLRDGTYDAASGETWQYEVPSDVTLTGESRAATILSGSGSADGALAPTALRASGNLQLRSLSLVAFQPGLDVATSAHIEIHDAALLGGVMVNDASSSLSIDGSTLEGTNAAVNFAGTRLDIKDSQIHAGTGAYGISLRAGTLTLTDSSIDGGNYGVYQLAGKSTLRRANITDYASIGLYFANGAVDLGRATEAGDNAFVGRAGTNGFGIYVDTDTTPVTCSNTSFDGVVPPAGTVQAGTTEIAEPGAYFITPGQRMQFFDVPE
jgi:hypothetical protein